MVSETSTFHEAQEILRYFHTTNGLDSDSQVRKDISIWGGDLVKVKVQNKRFATVDESN